MAKFIHIPSRLLALSRQAILLTLTIVTFIAEGAPMSRPDSVRSAALCRLLASPAIDSTRFAILVTDLSTGKTLTAHATDTPLVPASIMKSVTTATLLKEKGAKWRYETDVYADGPVRRGVLDGNLVIMGSGDPTINTSASSAATADFITEICEALKRREIDSITGKILVDNSLFAGPATPPTWASGDLPHSYGTGSHAFNFEDNSRGQASVSNPAAAFETKLTSALRGAGVKVAKGDVDSGKRHKLMTHQSLPIEDIMRSCMMRSDNLYAESMLRTLSARKGKDGSTESGAKIETDYWKKHDADMRGVVIVDGSGLSRSNRVTAEFMTDVLQKMAENVDYASFFPLAGQEGTLRNFMKGTRLDSYLAMKTGSMNGIQCYAGYLLDDDFAPTHTIVVICNNLKNRGAMRTALSDFFLQAY